MLISGELKEESADLVLLRTLARDLIGQSDADSTHISASLRELEARWEELRGVLVEREGEVGARERLLEGLEALRESVGGWLALMQGRVDGLPPPGVELGVIRDQDDQLHVSSVQSAFCSYVSRCDGIVISRI